MNKIIQGDCLEELKKLEDNSVDAVVTDPPYGLSFMGKKWDYDVPSVEIWSECLRVLKPGGYLLAFAGTRTQHRMAVRIEDAGFEIRDMIAWVYGSGFPKSLNIAKAIDKMEGVEHPKNIPISDNGSMSGANYTRNKMDVQSELGKQWEGWGTALKPALEPITVARKPLSEKTVAENCLKWGVGGINIDGCRVGTNGEQMHETTYPAGRALDVGGSKRNTPEIKIIPHELGRFPANLIHDGSDEVVELFPESKGDSANRKPRIKHATTQYGFGDGNEEGIETRGVADSGSAARFFYCAKASKSERNKGCEGLEEKELENHSATFDVRMENGVATNKRTDTKRTNNHPTVKPIALMEYLVKLVSKENHVVLDPFAGSGSTGVACKNLNRNYILIEREPDYIEIIKKRIESIEPKLFP